MPDFNQVKPQYSDLAANDASFWVGVLDIGWNSSTKISLSGALYHAYIDPAH